MLREWQKRVREGVRAGSAADSLFRVRADRFSYYGRAHWLRVSESLREDFPLTERLLGVRGLEARLREFLAVDRGYELELGELSGRFSAWLGAASASALARALALDSLAVEARRAPEPAAGKLLGLHPSARFLEQGARRYVFWRDGEGDVLRERISLRTFRVLRLFGEPVPAEAIPARMAGLGEEFSFVHDTLEECLEAGLLVYCASAT